ncbi:hypothetical protein ACS0TY_017455 [Phlomoides rotata]
MPRTRATELPQRPSPRAPTNVQTSSSSDSDPIHHRRSPKLTNGRSPRSTQSDPVNQKKLGTRIADLECQLGQAQGELKCLKDQLVSAEAAKKAAQEQLNKKSKRVKKVGQGLMIKKDSIDECETCDDDDVVEKETDVFEVPMETKRGRDQEGSKIKLDEREKELEVYHQENAKMKTELHEKSIKISSVECEVHELASRLSKINQELEKSRMDESQMREKVEETEKAKEVLENEMKRLRVQTEQWRKAAEAAASVLAGEVEINERRMSERCGSMDKQYGNAFEQGGGYVGSPGLMEDSDDGGGKRKGSGIRMFGDLWRKKGHK